MNTQKPPEPTEPTEAEQELSTIFSKVVQFQHDGLTDDVSTLASVKAAKESLRAAILREREGMKNDR